MKTSAFLIISHSVEWEMFQAKVEKIRTYILCSVTFVLKIISFIRCKNIVESDTSQMTVWRTLIVCWMSKTTNTLKMCKSYGFSTATMVAQMHLNVTLHIHFLTCYMIFDVTVWSLSWHFSIYSRIYTISFSFWYQNYVCICQVEYRTTVRLLWIVSCLNKKTYCMLYIQSNTTIFQLVVQWVYDYLGYNYMFRPYLLAIFRLYFNLSKSYPCYGGGGGARSGRYNSGWYDLGILWVKYH
jgi:hypothetical protein